MRYLIISFLLSGCINFDVSRSPASFNLDQSVKEKIEYGLKENLFSYCSPKNINKINTNNRSIVDYLKRSDGDENLHMSSFLNNMPKDIFKNVATVISSKSLQGATFHGPRFILFDGADTDTREYKSDNRSNFTGSIMTVNMDSSQRGYKHLEIMLWSSKSENFNVIDVAFNEDLKSPIVTVNPTKCTGCHTAFRKPNWESYNFWPNSLPVVGESFNFKIEKDAIDSISKMIDESSNFKWKFIKSLNPVSIFFNAKKSDEVFHDFELNKSTGGLIHDDLQRLNRCRRENIIFNKEKNKQLVQMLVGYLNYCIKSKDENLNKNWKPSDFMPDKMISRHNDYFKNLLNVQDTDIPKAIYNRLKKLNVSGLKRRIEEFKHILEKNGYTYNSTIDRLLNAQASASYNEEMVLPSEFDKRGFPPDLSADKTLREFSFLWYVLAPLGVNVDHWSLSINPLEKTFGDNTVVSNEILLTAFPYKNGFCSDPKTHITKEITRFGIEKAYDRVNHAVNDNFNLPAFDKFINQKSSDLAVQSFLESGENAYKVRLMYLKWSEMDINSAIEKGIL